MKHFATAISVLFHPLFIYYYTLSYFMLSAGWYYYFRPQSLFYYNLTLLLLTVVLPLIAGVLFEKDIFMKNARSRLTPLIISAGFYFFAYYIFRSLPFPPFLLDYLLAAFICLFLAYWITHLMKISLHAISMGASISFFIYSYYNYGIDLRLVFAIIFLAALVGSCRLFLKAHDLKEILSGYALGFIATTAAMLVTI